MKLPTTKRISHEDLPEAPEWIPKLLLPINTFFDAVYNALMGKLTFEDNFLSQTKELSFSTPSNYGCSGFNVITFPSTLKKKATGVIMMEIVKNVDPHEAIRNGVSVDWQDNGGSLTHFLIIFN